ncbi:MAG TPA: biotin/lipoyl-binding protein, partial [Bacteroidetes bacterium]|nr:biotin/lipoyl-binding protein [Bacteroidota bacterium]
MIKFKVLVGLFVVFGFIACDNQETKSDAYGNFEAIEYNVASEVPGKIIKFEVSEGQELKKNQIVAVIDTVLLHSQKKVLSANIKAIKSKLQNVKPELEVLEEQKRHILHEKERLQKLVEGNAATQKQVDDLDSQLRVLEKRIAATKSKVSDINRGIMAQISPLKAQLEQVNERINKSIIRNPIDGQV